MTEPYTNNKYKTELNLRVYTMISTCSKYSWSGMIFVFIAAVKLSIPCKLGPSGPGVAMMTIKLGKCFSLG